MRCPHCYQKTDPDSLICLECRRDITPPPLPVPAPPEDSVTLFLLRQARRPPVSRETLWQEFTEAAKRHESLKFPEGMGGSPPEPTFTAEEVHNWLYDPATPWNADAESPEHGITAWKARRRSTQARPAAQDRSTPASEANQI